jgi:hypothetical protein
MLFVEEFRRASSQAANNAMAAAQALAAEQQGNEGLPGRLGPGSTPPGANSQPMWIMKPSSKSQGKGIFLINKLSQVGGRLPVGDWPGALTVRACSERMAQLSLSMCPATLGSLTSFLHSQRLRLCPAGKGPANCPGRLSVFEARWVVQSVPAWPLGCLFQQKTQLHRILYKPVQRALLTLPAQVKQWAVPVGGCLPPALRQVRAANHLLRIHHFSHLHTLRLPFACAKPAHTPTGCIFTSHH